jgi:hypothetical protein
MVTSHKIIHSHCPFRTVSVLSPIAKVYMRKKIPPAPPPPHTQGEYQQMSSGENTKNSKKGGTVKEKEVNKTN